MENCTDSNNVRQGQLSKLYSTRKSSFRICCNILRIIKDVWKASNTMLRNDFIHRRTNEFRTNQNCLVNEPKSRIRNFSFEIKNHWLFACQVHHRTSRKREKPRVRQYSDLPGCWITELLNLRFTFYILHFTFHIYIYKWKYRKAREKSQVSFLKKQTSKRTLQQLIQTSIWIE